MPSRPDPDLLVYAAMKGQRRYDVCLAPRDTTYSPHDAVYEACVEAVKVYLAEVKKNGVKLLSKRELQVLTLTTKGMTQKEIATQLHIGASTVKTHLCHIYAKLEVRDRASAVAKAMTLGILD